MIYKLDVPSISDLSNNFYLFCKFLFQLISKIQQLYYTIIILIFKLTIRLKLYDICDKYIMEIWKYILCFANTT